MTAPATAEKPVKVPPIIVPPAGEPPVPDASEEPATEAALNATQVRTNSIAQIVPAAALFGLTP